MLEFTVMVRLCRTCRVRQITIITVCEADQCGGVVYIVSNFFFISWGVWDLVLWEIYITNNGWKAMKADATILVIL